MAISKKELTRQKHLEEEKQCKEQTRLEMEERVHQDKVTNSAAMFQNTKITSCSKVLQKNG